jgi:hypothetical protein
MLVALVRGERIGFAPTHRSFAKNQSRTTDCMFSIMIHIVTDDLQSHLRSWPYREPVGIMSTKEDYTKWLAQVSTFYQWTKRTYHW